MDCRGGWPPSRVDMASFVSPSAYSRLAKCPICDRSVHKVLIESHVEICLERQASGVSPSPAGELGDRLLARDLGDATQHGGTPTAVSASPGGGAGGRASFVAAASMVRPRTAPASTSATQIRDGGANLNNAGGTRTPFDVLMGKDKASGAEEKENLDGWRKAGGGPVGGHDASYTAPSSDDNNQKRSTAGPLRQWFKQGEHHQPPTEPSPVLKRARVSDPGDARASKGPDEGKGPDKGEGPDKGKGCDEGKGQDEGEANDGANEENEEEEARREDPAAAAATAEALGDGGLVNFPLKVMSGSHDACGICLETFTEGGEAPVSRYVFWPCQHVRQCGDCALRIWQVPKAKRRCPWCKSKIDIRPRPFKPFL